MNESLNLNMLAVKKEYQSKGIGNFFLKNIISDINKSKSFNILIWILSLILLRLFIEYKYF